MKFYNCIIKTHNVKKCGSTKKIKNLGRKSSSLLQKIPITLPVNISKKLMYFLSSSFNTWMNSLQFARIKPAVRLLLHQFPVFLKQVLIF